MKKSLVALAVLAATGAASAQSNVSISGLVGFAYQSFDSIAPAKANRGLTTTDVLLNFGLSEDLGAGRKLEAGFVVEAGAGNFASAMTRTDTFLSVSANGYGTLRFDQTRTGNLLTKAMVAPSSLPEGMYDTSGIFETTKPVLPGRFAAEVLSYTTPDFGGFTGTAAYAEAVNDGSTVPGVTAGIFVLNYAKGPLAAGFAVKSFYINPAVVINPLRTTRTEAYATYDFGVAQVGVGFDGAQVGSNVANATDDASAVAFGVAVPMGAITLGANWAKRDVNTVSEFVAKYDLSKRTSMNFSIGKQSVDADPTVGAANVGTTGNQYRIAMFHSF